jgi:hypothetical protein
MAIMSPRIIHIPLSGGDRKAQAKGIRYAHGIHESAYRESVLIRSAAEAKIRDARWAAFCLQCSAICSKRSSKGGICFTLRRMELSPLCRRKLKFQTDPFEIVGEVAPH